MRDNCGLVQNRCWQPDPAAPEKVSGAEKLLVDLFDTVRLIEVDLTIHANSVHARREKSIRRRYISTLHIWLAQRHLEALLVRKTT